ncbi:DUF2071 domain-containing protein [Herbidospora sp. NEAU-GS84]|uniref:DUF2071 domain-containing protein n=1 Tax=Herbidospora solisilvae TaxID=2696284 RepID=A0A7C9JB61_9ACTN|nr:DUF2071 domain-containing protein [Herbidospora solisilvae]NAS22104.1 DUF2071 domain-containing protein [Herbidospora solisilvae]
MVTLPVMYQSWSHITFLHWRFPAALIQSLLPPGLTAERHDGSAWVGLTPFLMEDVRPPVVPALPWLSRFPETNVRTYVHDEQGRGGLWFLSLDAARLPAVAAGRAGYWLPYYWSAMSVRVDADRVAYRCRRHGRAGISGDVDVEIGEPVAPEALTDFLTERYRLFTVVAGRLATAEVEHPRWSLRRARVTALDQNLLQAAGLSADAAPIAHTSEGVRVRVGMWRWC